MKSSQGQSVSVWMAGESMPGADNLRQDLNADVCVIGAGIAGLTTACILSLHSKSVVLLDAAGIAEGVTALTTAHLANALDDYFYVLQNLHGSEGARLAAESHGAAIDWIERSVRMSGIDCDFTRLPGYLFAPDEQAAEIIELELVAAKKAGLQVSRLDSAPWPFYRTGPCLKFERQAQFHPLRYLKALLRIYQKNGGKVFAHTRVRSVSGGYKPEVYTEAGPIVRAQAVVVAANAPLGDVVLSAKQSAFRTFVITASVPRNSVPLGLYWDTLDPYHYVRLYGDWLIVGGEDHKTGQADDAADRYERLEHWMRERFPMAGRVEYRWSGQILEPVDGLAFIGKSHGSENVYLITGDSGNGLTHGTLGGMLISNMIMGEPNPWERIYNPSRFAPKSAKEFLKENLNVARQFGDWLSPGSVPENSSIARGAGGILRDKTALIAAYRDEEGSLHQYSAVCPHLKCIVAWNSEEKTWDCPCHGSRFDAYGTVLTGPSLRGLEPIGKKIEEKTV